MDSRAFKQDEVIKRSLRNNIYEVLKKEAIEYLRSVTSIHVTDAPNMFPKYFVSEVLLIDVVIKRSPCTFLIESDHISLKYVENASTLMQSIKRSPVFIEAFSHTCSSWENMMKAQEVWRTSSKEHRFFVAWLLQTAKKLYPQNYQSYKIKAQRNFIQFIARNVFGSKKSTFVKEITNHINIVFAFDTSTPDADDVISNKLVLNFIENHRDFKVSGNVRDDCGNCCVEYIASKSSANPIRSFDYFSYIDEVSQLNKILDPKMTFHQIITVFDTWKRNGILFENSVKPFGTLSSVPRCTYCIENEKVLNIPMVSYCSKTESGTSASSNNISSVT